jgi:UDP-N-acetylglucosamine 1-carboxyvinyltransferase
MATLVIDHDGTPLTGQVGLDGGKHAFAHSLACAALADRGRLTEVPDHIDARALRAALALVFDRVSYDRGTRALTFAEPVHRTRITVPRELAALSRSLFCLLPALLVRVDEVVVQAAPRGCQIGDRPTGWYQEVLARFGVRAVAAGSDTILSWPPQARRPACVRFPYPSMTGTVMALAAAAVAPGRSTVHNGSREPSCAEQLGCLRAMGGAVTDALPTVEIDGRPRYDRVVWAVAADRIHAVTYLTAGLLTGGEVTVAAAQPLRIPRFVDFLRRCGAQVTDAGHAVTAGPPPGGRRLRPIGIAAGSEPLFSSDWLPFATLLLAIRGAGTSVLSDDVFLRRFQFVGNLAPHGLDAVRLHRGRRGRRPATYADIAGAPTPQLRSGNYGTCADIRGSAAILLAGLVAGGPCTLSDDFHLRRGYTDLPAGLRALGARRVERLTEGDRT